MTQDGALNPGNLLDNIIGFGEDLTIDDAWKAAKLAAVDSDIAAMPMQMFTAVGDRASTFSGGQIQRVTIARALVNNPALVWADEPTGNLDVGSSTEVLWLMQRLNREKGQTFVIVTHDPQVAALCGRIVRMEDGEIVANE